jgi:hypothetical protein
MHFVKRGACGCPLKIETHFIKSGGAPSQKARHISQKRGFLGVPLIFISKCTKTLKNVKEIRKTKDLVKY